MGNIISYLKWRGDLSFRENPFNEVDNFICSYLSYFDFAGIVPGADSGEAVRLREAAAAYLGEGRDQGGFVEPEFLEALAETRRFGNAVLWGYEDVMDNECEMTQFAALHICMEDGTDYLAFRGTDNTIVGWREDFRISFETVPAQARAAEYMEKTVGRRSSGRCLAGGHSKGGNLALYAAVMVSDDIKGRIEKIYMNDSPGLCGEMLDKDGFRKVEGKVVRIVPEFCIIGMLFEKDVPEKVVKSSSEGILQHDILSWQVEGAGIDMAQGLSAKCGGYNALFDRWIESVGMEQRRTFTNDFFDALGAGGAKTMTEIAAGGKDQFEAILYAMTKSERDSRKVVGKLLKSLLTGVKGIDYRELFRTRKMFQGAALLLTGALFVAFPGTALKMIGTAFFLWLLLFSLSKIYALAGRKNEWGIREKLKLAFYSAIAVLEMLCILFNHIIVVSANLVLVFFLGWRAFARTKEAAADKAAGNRKWRRNAAEALLDCMFAMVIVAKSGRDMEGYVLAVGAYLAIIGMKGIWTEILEAAKRGH